MITLSLFLAATAALFELLVLGLRALGDGFVFAGPIVFWMIPLSYACFLLPLGAVAAVFARRGEAWRNMMVGGLAAVTIFSASFLFHPKVHLIAVAMLAFGGGVQASRVLSPRWRTTQRVARIGAVVLIAWIGLAAAGERFATSMPRGSQVNATSNDAQPNVVLLILDTVRAASMSLYGHDRLTTPNLDRLAARAVVFDQAVSPSPWTLPAHASIFTGVPPHELSADWDHGLADSPPTLAERFTDAGYRTGGFVANVAYASAETGLSRGFEYYEDYIPSVGGLITSSSLGRFFANNPRLRQLIGYHDVAGRRIGEQMNARALRWMRSDSISPMFLFINYYDAHEPYLPAAPFDTLFGRTTGRNMAHMRQISAHMASRAHKFSMSEEERELERLAYEQSIAWLDAEVGQLLDSLSAHEAAGGRRTIVAITSDHGEQFLERGLFGHGNGLYLPSLHVPLLIAGPGVPGVGSRRRDVVSTTDLGATLLSLASVSDAAGFGGHSLFSGSVTDLATSSIRPARNQDSDYPSFRGKMYSATTATMHVIRNADGTIEQFMRGVPVDSAGDQRRALDAIDNARSREFGQTDRIPDVPAKR